MCTPAMPTLTPVPTFSVMQLSLLQHFGQGRQRTLDLDPASCWESQFVSSSVRRGVYMTSLKCCGGHYTRPCPMQLGAHWAAESRVQNPPPSLGRRVPSTRVVFSANRMPMTIS